MADIDFTVASLRAAYADGVRPADIVREAFRRIAAADDPGIFLSLVDEGAAIAAAEAARIL